MTTESEIDEMAKAITAEHRAAVAAMTPHQLDAVRRLGVATTVAQDMVINGDGPPAGSGVYALICTIREEAEMRLAGEVTVMTCAFWDQPSPEEQAIWGISPVEPEVE